MPSFRAMLRLAACVALGAAAGCALLVPLDDLSGGAAAGDGGSVDTGVTVDGTISEDAGSDGNVETHFCDGVDARVCLDFDRDNWMGGLSPSVSNGVLDRGTTAPKSAPYHLVASTPSGRTAASKVVLDVPLAAASEITWAFDVRIDELAADNGLELCQLILVGCAVQPYISGSSVGVVEYCGTGPDGGSLNTSYRFADRPPLGEWHRVKLRVMLAGPLTITVWLDSDPMPVVDNKVLPRSRAGSALLQLGTSFVASSQGATRMSYDNMVVNVR